MVGGTSGSPGREIRANEFFIISGKDVAVGEGGVGPGDAAALAELFEGGFDQLGTADFVVAFWCEPGDDQFAMFVEEPGCDRCPGSGGRWRSGPRARRTKNSSQTPGDTFSLGSKPPGGLVTGGQSPCSTRG